VTHKHRPATALTTNTTDKEYPLMPEIVFVRNPSGAVHDVLDTHPAAALAKNQRDGWKLATKTEVIAACKRARVDPAPHLKHLEEN
jgi:hypothetical protein